MAAPHDQLQQAEESLAALRAECVDSLRRLQLEIAQVGDALSVHQQRTAALEAELARMRATRTWRLRNRLLQLGIRPRRRRR